MYKIGDEFVGTWPIEAADWCNHNGCWMETFKVDEDGTEHHRIAKSVPDDEELSAEPTLEERLTNIEDALIELAGMLTEE